MKQVSDLELKLRANPATAQYSQLLTAAIVIAYVVLLLTLLQLCVSLITAVCGFLLRWKLRVCFPVHVAIQHSRISGGTE